MNIIQVTFFLTDRCSAACPVCCFQCTPKNTFIMDENVIRRYIDEGASLGTVKLFSYTGGECMLYPDLLERVCRYAKEKYDIPSSTVSNGFWAADYEKGKETMLRLKDAGLTGVRLSADDYHQQFVSEQTIKNAIMILGELGMLPSITVMDTKDRSNLRHVFERLRPEIYLAPMVSYYPLHLPSAVLKNRNVKLTTEDLETPVSWDDAFCPDCASVQLYTDGYMYNCCSQFSFEMPAMRIGKIGETTLAEAERYMNRDPVLDLIRRESVSWFAVKARELGFTVKEKFSSSCELCRDLLCNRELMEKLVPLAKKEVQNRRMEKLFDVMKG